MVNKAPSAADLLTPDQGGPPAGARSTAGHSVQQRAAHSGRPTLE